MDTVTLTVISLTRFKDDLHEASVIDSERQRFRSVELLWFWLCGQLLFFSFFRGGRGGCWWIAVAIAPTKMGTRPIFAVRKRSCGKVMFLHLSVSHSVHRGGGVCPSACWDTPPGTRGRHPPLGRLPPFSRRLLLRTIHILLECILVNYAYSSVQKSDNRPYNRNSVNLL